MKKALLVALAIAIAALGLVACGGSDSSSDTGTETTAESTESGGEAAGGGGGAEGGTAGSASVIDFETAEGSALAYTATEASAKAGTDTINFNNVQATPHDVAIEDEGGKEVGKTEVISEESTSAKVKLEPGTYTFFCTIPGHREAGMEGTLTVK